VSEFPTANALVDSIKSRIKSAVEGAKQRQIGLCGLGVATRRSFGVLRDGLLRKHGLSRAKAVHDEAFVSEGRRGNQASVDLGIVVDFVGVL